MIAARSGWVVRDMYGHEGSGVPGPCGVLMVGESGSMARVYYFPRSKWGNPSYGSVGPARKAMLLAFLKGVQSELEPLDFRDIFGWPEGTALGGEDALTTARTFVEALSGRGSDEWLTSPAY